MLELNSLKTVNLSLNPLSLSDLPWVDGQGLLRVQHTAAERRLGATLLYPCEMKQGRQKAPGFI